MSSLTYLPLQQSEIPSSASSLISAFLSSTSWIWPSEDPSLYPPPYAPTLAQRAFRLTWTNPSPKSRTPSSTTIVITADNYFELFVNGILLHAADANHAWETPLMFKVPLSASSGKITYAVRVVNGYNDAGKPDSDPNPAGLRAAIQIDFTPSSSPEVLYTDGGGNWVSSPDFGNGWEQPGFKDGGWEVAKAMPTTWPGSSDLVWNTMNSPSQFYVATSLPPSEEPGPTSGPPTGVPGPTSTPTSSTSQSTNIPFPGVTTTTSSSGVTGTTSTLPPILSSGELGPIPTPTDPFSAGLPQATQSNIAFPRGEPSGILVGVVLCAVVFRAFMRFLVV